MEDLGLASLLSIVSLVSAVLNVKAVVAALNQEKALVGAFSVIVKNRWMVYSKH